MTRTSNEEEGELFEEIEENHTYYNKTEHTASKNNLKPKR